MKSLKLLTYISFIITTSVSASTIPNDKFQFGIGNSGFSPAISIECDNSDISPISVPLNTSAYTPIKHIEKTTQITCEFSHEEEYLGEITLELIIDAHNNVINAAIVENTLDGDASEIIHTSQELFVYFSSNENTV